YCVWRKGWGGFLGPGSPIGILKLDESPSQIRKPRSQIEPLHTRRELFESNLRFRISDLRWAFVQFQNSLLPTVFVLRKQISIDVVQGVPGWIDPQIAQLPVRVRHHQTIHIDSGFRVVVLSKRTFQEGSNSLAIKR